ncbi:MAG: gamma-glutamyl-gamma-aminobutyrate hydrolase family protein [Clostridia bacterium]|nr:gamma-glutamyl-gamma-aminobutyrate hydrolase family protein [Clostridia bacterium]
MKPLIGVVPLIDYKRESLWMIPGYMDGVRAAGGVPVMLPLGADGGDIRFLAETMSGFLFTGGQDVSPEHYDTRRSPLCGEVSPERDALEFALLREVLRLDKPVLGICRGIQLLNVFSGGTLYQDLPSEHPSEVRHQMKPPYDRTAHEVYINEDSMLCRITGERRITVNSYHHQAVKELGAGLVCAAQAPDGVVEAAELPEKRFVLAVQWHPEFDFHKSESSQRLFSAFVGAAEILK